MFVTGDTDFKKAHFDLVGEIVAVGYYDPFYAWNGFHTPFFDLETCKKIIALIEPVNGVEIEFKRNEEDNGYIINDDTDGVSDTFYELDREVVVDGDSIVVNGLCDRWVWDIIRQHSVGDYNDMIKKGTIKSTVEQVPVIEDED